MKKIIIPTKDRVKIPVTLNFYEDWWEQLALLAEKKGFSGPKALVMFYLSDKFREDWNADLEKEYWNSQPTHD
jgi:hypothetical protein